MKISPVPQGTGMPAAEIGGASTQRTSPDRIAAAKAIAAGEQKINILPSEREVDPQVARAQQAMRKIKMRTQVSTDRGPEETLTEPPLEADQSAISDNTEQDPAATEETKPLSPQFAALAKQRRSLQVKERELQEREKALESRSATDGGTDILARIKQEPLSVLMEAGVSYEQLTEAILNGQEDPKVARLQARIDALEKGLDTKFTDRDQQAKTQVLAEMQREAEKLVADGDAYEMVRTENKVPSAIKLIEKIYDDEGVVLEVSEALDLIENDLIEQTLKRAQLSKMRSRLSPTQETEQTTQQQPRDTGMKTLTNRDGARPVMDRRSRAIAAALGQLKK